MRTSGQQLNFSLKNQVTKTLAQLLVDLKTLPEAVTFLADFFNEKELETYAKRLGIAYWLKKGRSYANIKDNLKISSATIASIEKQMQKPGIVLALAKLEAEEWANVWAQKIKKITKI